MFAKLYETKEYGQVLVKIDRGDDGDPEVRTYFQPVSLGVCSLAITFDDTDGGWGRAEKMFDNMTEESAKSMIRDVVDDDMIQDLVGEDE